MAMDLMRSHGLSRARLLANSEEETLIRWFPCAPGALPFPDFHATGYPVWEEFPDEFAGAGVFLKDQEWRGKRYPAPPGQHFHGELEWFQAGLPRAQLGTSLPLDRCGSIVVYGQGGCEVGGAAGIAVPSITTCTVCTQGAFPTYIVRVRGVQDGTRSASEVNGDWPVHHTTLCIWQGPRTLKIGAAFFFWQFGIGGVQRRVQFRSIGAPGSLVIWDSTTPYDCFHPVTQTFTSGDTKWDWSSASVEVLPYA